MVERTKGIVLQSIKYGESSLIVKIFTADYGLLSFILKGILKNKRGKLHPSYFLPLSILQLHIYLSQKSDIHQIKEAQLLHVYDSLQTDFKKQAVVFFLSEILANIFQNNIQDSKGFEFVEKALIWFDVHSFIPHFHIYFLLRLTKYLGFYPSTNFQGAFFDMEKGTFENTAVHAHCTTENESKLLKTYLGINFDALSQTQMNHEERQQMNEMMLKYYSIHVPSFKNLKSLDVLKAIM